MVKSKRTKQTLALIVVFCLVVTSVFVSTQISIDAASASVPSASGKITTSGGAYIRAKASASSSKVKLAAKGSSFTISSEKFTSKNSTSLSKRWYYTSYKGYVRADLASISYKSITGTTTASLNARSGAGTGFASKKVFSKGAKLTIVLKAYDYSGKLWYKVKSGSSYYYVSASYVKLGSTSSSSVTSSTVTTLKTTGTTTDAVNARSGAGTKYAVKATYAKGKKLTIVGKTTVSGVVWYKLSNGYYVCGTYVKLASTSSSSTTSSTSGVTALNTTGTTTDAINARSGAGTSYAIKTTYAKGKKLTIVGKTTVSGVVWYKLSNGYYVCGTYVKLASSSSSSSSSSGTTMNTTGRTTDYVNARSGPGTSYAIKALYATGTSLNIVGQTTVSGTVWYKTSAGYYVCGDYITIGTSSSTSASNTAAMSNAEFKTYLTNQGFPSSYITPLLALHAEHPNWDFKAVNTGLSWSDALSKMTSSNANTIHSSYKLGYRDVGKGSYNFLTNSYIAKDGSDWFKASDVGVAYFMDPRNWLDEVNVFMFEDHAYNPSYQTETIVKKVLNLNTTLKSASSSFMTAGKTYNINPVYLASKSYNELGTYKFMIDGHSFTYNSKTYSGCYNAFNIGATDTSTGSAAINGLVYANGGVNGTATSYGRKWNTLAKAILGGAQFLAEDFVANNQDTGYLEHFNVMNGLSKVGTHVYMTAVYAPSSMAYTTHKNYKSYNVLDETFVFKIPVYSGMPSSASPKASEYNNNCYLKALSYTAGSTTSNLIICNSANIDTVYETSFSKTVANSVTSITLKGTTSDSSASVTGLGTKSLSVGKNTFKITCKAPSGKTRTYTVTITRAS